MNKEKYETPTATKVERPVIKLVAGNQMIIEMPKTLDEWYEELNCSCMTVTYRYIGGKMYAIFADDEGLLKENFSITMILDYIEQDKRAYDGTLVGNLIIATAETDEVGNTLPLDVSDITHINKHMVSMYGTGPYGGVIQPWVVKM